MRTGIRVFCLVALISAMALPGAARAEDVYVISVKKQDDKAQNRWSLQDWLNTRDRMRMMDLWLALHSPSPYEFFIDGDYRFTDGGAAAPFSHWGFSGGAYASIFGLEASRLVSDRS